jgi:hypothetical protein
MPQKSFFTKNFQTGLKPVAQATATEARGAFGPQPAARCPGLGGGAARAAQRAEHPQHRPVRVARCGGARSTRHAQHRTTHQRIFGAGYSAGRVRAIRTGINVQHRTTHHRIFHTAYSVRVALRKNSWVRTASNHAKRCGKLAAGCGARGLPRIGAGCKLFRKIIPDRFRIVTREREKCSLARHI